MKNTSKVLIALGVITLVSGVIRVLLSPGKGSETRRLIADTGKKFSDKFKKNLKAGKTKLDEQFNPVNNKTEQFA